MFGFGNKKLRQENQTLQLRLDGCEDNCELLEKQLKAEKEQTDVYLRGYETKKKELATCKLELQGQLDIANGNILKATAEIELCYSMMCQLREQVAQGEAYKADNLTLISRVAQTQELLADERARHDKTQAELAELTNIAKELVRAVETAKAKRAQVKKNVRKKKRK